jgi:hypothetical protein
MAEIWDIARYVEEHPEDHDQRWRLAKKLYMAWEYRLALEHLQVLKNEWEHKVNVVRYLAATYYRLGRYEEAIRELESAIENWPDELGLREQLARVYEMADRRERAAEVWESVNDLDPQHPIARSAVKRLRKRIKEGDKPSEDLRLGDSDSGIDLSEGFVCPACGAQNSSEYDRCWQCHAALHESGKNAVIRKPEKKEKSAVPSPSPETFGLIAGISLVVLLAIAIYLSVTLFGADDDFIATSLREVYETDMGLTRVVWGGMMILLWPAILWLSITLLDVRPKVSANFVTVTGLSLAALLYILTWLPAQVLLLIPIVPAAISLVIILGAFGVPPGKGAAVWALQLALVIPCAILAFVVADKTQSERALNPFTDLPALVRYAGEDPVTRDDRFAAGTTPMSFDVEWESTGSPWLDSRAKDMRFRIISEEGDQPIKFEIQDNSGTRAYETVTGKQWDYRFPISPGEPYRLILTGAQGVRAQLEVHGLLRPLPANGE